MSGNRSFSWKLGYHVRRSEHRNERRRRDLIKNISDIVWNLMLIRQINDFLAEIMPFMMYILIANVFNDGLFVGFADTECGISFLPCKQSPVWKSLMNPTR
jgi:hypothetical protein